MVGAKCRPPDHESITSHPGGVPEFLHAFSVRNPLNDDPVVCGPPATIYNAFGVKITAPATGFGDSFVAQGDQRIHLRRAPGGNVAGE